MVEVGKKYVVARTESSLMFEIVEVIAVGKGYALIQTDNGVWPYKIEDYVWNVLAETRVITRDQLKRLMCSCCGNNTKTIKCFEGIGSRCTFIDSAWNSLVH